MEVNGKQIEIVNATDCHRHIKGKLPGVPREQWEMRDENGETVGLIFDRQLAKALGAKV